MLPSKPSSIFKSFSLLAVLFAFVLIPESNGQEPSDSVESAEASPHQLGFPATSTFRFLTRGDQHTYELHYRYRYAGGRHYRFGISHRYSSADSDQLILNARLGLDRAFKQTDQWQFYTGADLALGIEKRSTSSLWYYSAGIIPFIGAQFRPIEHFSVSTEPGLLVRALHYNNSSSFTSTSTETWVEMEFTGVGQLIISVHF